MSSAFDKAEINIVMPESNNIDENVFITSIGKSKSGAVVSFNDGEGGSPVKDLTIDIEAVQSGEGDPSLENIRPISGWTGANIHKTGLNILPSYSYWTQQNCTMTLDNSSSTFTLTNTGSSGFRQVLLQGDNRLTLPKGTGRKLRVYCKFESSNTNLNPRMMIYDQDSNSVLTKTTSDTWETITLADSVQKLQVILRLTQSNTNLQSSDVVTFKNVQLQYGDSSTEFSGINFTIIPITWTSAGTVYGGTLDATTGVLTVTHRYLEVSSCNSVGTASTNVQYASIALGSGNGANSDHSTNISSSYEQTESAPQTDGYFRLSGSTLYIYDNRFTDKATADAVLTSELPQVVYKLATPQVIQLAPQEIQTFFGENNIWSDNGNISVIYGAKKEIIVKIQLLL